MSCKDRLYEVKREFMKDKNGKILWFYKIPNSGDYVVNWTIIAKTTRHLNANIIINDVKLPIKNVNQQRDFSKYNFCIKDLRKEISDLKLPETDYHNKLLLLEQIFHALQLESYSSVEKILSQKKMEEGKGGNRIKENRTANDFPKYEKKVVDDTIWMGDVVVVIDIGKSPPPTLLINETYFPLCSLIYETTPENKEKDKENKGEGVKGNSDDIMKAMGFT